LVRIVFTQSDADQVQAQFTRLIDSSRTAGQLPDRVVTITVQFGPMEQTESFRVRRTGPVDSPWLRRAGHSMQRPCNFVATIRR
jgi:hypothetical protein